MFAFKAISRTLLGLDDYFPNAAAAEMVPHKPFQLLALPPELRNAIYEFVFARQKLIIPALHSQDFYHAAPALLVSCKQIYNEAIIMYYSSTLFYVQYSLDLVWFTKIAVRFQESIAGGRICGFQTDQAEAEREIECCFEKFNEKGLKLMRDVLYVAVFSDDNKGMVWTNEGGEAGRETLAELDDAYNRSRMNASRPLEDTEFDMVVECRESGE